MFLGGMMSESPLNFESEFIDAYKANKLTPFVLKILYLLNKTANS